MTPELRLLLTRLATPSPGLAPNDRGSFDFKILAAHKAIADALHRVSTARPVHLASLVHCFTGFFLDYHADLGKALAHAERYMNEAEQALIRPLHWHQLLARLHFYVSDAYWYRMQGWDVLDLRQPEADTEERIGAPVSMAQALFAVAFWADAMHFNLCAILEPNVPPPVP
jgi:hypothetical protein